MPDSKQDAVKEQETRDAKAKMDAQLAEAKARGQEIGDAVQAKAGEVKVAADAKAEEAKAALQAKRPPTLEERVSALEADVAALKTAVYHV